MRIGNWVNNDSNDNKEAVCVDAITESGGNISLPECSYEIAYSKLSPIYLTDELILRCGFEKKEGALFGLLPEHYYMKGGVIICKNEGAYQPVSCCDSAFYGCKFGEPILALHQLQNLYFAVTGKELEIDLSKN